MTWLGILTLGAFGVFMSLAFKRGVILELADLACIIIGGFLSFRMFRPISQALHKGFLSGFSLGFLEKSVILTIFTVSGLVIFSIGLTVRRRAKEEKHLEEDIDQRLGLVVGLFKAVMVILLLLGLVFYNDLFPKRDTRKLKSGVIVSKVLSLSPLVKPVVYLSAPTELAKSFIKKGFGPVEQSK